MLFLNYNNSEELRKDFLFKSKLDYNELYEVFSHFSNKQNNMNLC